MIMRLIVLTMTFFLCGCGSVTTTTQEPVLIPEDEFISRQETVNITAVGDIMIHDTQIASAHNILDNSYNFDDSFEEVAQYLNKADLTIGNLETTLAGEELQYSGYPCFNAPESLAKTLKDLGFDIIVTANNHAFDRKVEGVINTIYNLRVHGLEQVGTYRSSEERERVTIKDIKGVKIAVLAYTYGLNGFKVPEEQSYLVNLLDMQLIKQDIAKAKGAGVDFIITAVHFGTEYQTEPDNFQKEVVDKLLAAGVDIVLGSHPHVLQRAQFFGDFENKLVIYSLGNFISSQKGIERQTGAIYNIALIKDFATGKLTISKVDYIPVFTQRYREEQRLKFKVLPLEHTIQSKPYSFLTEADYDVLQKAWINTTNLLDAEPGIEVFREGIDF